MPTSKHRFDQHRLFLVEKRGDTLIVSPKGDPAGFANLNFNQEHSAILALLEEERIQNVLVNLRASNYFGAKILGAFADWSEVVVAKGGRFAVCEISQDMQELLHIFHFDEKWEQFETREKGVKELVHETPFETVRAHRKEVYRCAWAALILALFIFPVKQYLAQREYRQQYQTVFDFWADMQKLKNSEASPAEWRKFRNRADQEIVPLLAKFQSRKNKENSDGKISRYFCNAMEQNILKHLLAPQDRMAHVKPIGPEFEQYWRIATVQIEKARLIMVGRDPETIKFPKWSEYAAYANGSNNNPPSSPDSETTPEENAHRVPPAIAESSPERSSE